MRNTPVPTKLQANTVFLTLSALRGLVQDNMTKASGLGSDCKTSYAATLDNENSVKTYVKHRYYQENECKKTEKKKEKNKEKKKVCSQRHGTNVDVKLNDCPSCKKFERRKTHTYISHNKCM